MMKSALVARVLWKTYLYHLSGMKRFLEEAYRPVFLDPRLSELSSPSFFEHLDNISYGLSVISVADERSINSVHDHNIF